MKAFLLLTVALFSMPAFAEQSQITFNDGSKVGKALAVGGLSCVAGAALLSGKIDRLAGCGVGMAAGAMLVVGVESAMADEAPSETVLGDSNPEETQE